MCSLSVSFIVQLHCKLNTTNVVCVCMFGHIHTHTYMYTYVHTHIHTHTHTHTHTVHQVKSLLIRIVDVQQA